MNAAPQRQATLGLGRTFSADGKRVGGTPSANEAGRETFFSSGGTLRPHAGHSVGRTARESARRQSLARSNTGERGTFADADSAPRSEDTGNDPDADADTDVDADSDTDADAGPGRGMLDSVCDCLGSIQRFRRHEHRNGR